MRRVLLAPLLAGVLAGCGSSGPPSVTAAPPSTPPAATATAASSLPTAGPVTGSPIHGPTPTYQPSSTASSTVQVLRLNERSNLTTVQAQVGANIVVALSSTYWQFDTPDPAVLRGLSLPMTQPATGCAPGAGCGTVTVVYQVVAAGQAVISATRTSCGEALKCTPEQASYRVVVVSS
jgi:hypothetical protein